LLIILGMIRIAGILLISTIIYAFLIVDGKNELVRQVALATNPIFYNGTHMYGLDFGLVYRNCVF
jgi:hypothetical protein